MRTIEPRRQWAYRAGGVAAALLLVAAGIAPAGVGGTASQARRGPLSAPRDAAWFLAAQGQDGFPDRKNGNGQKGSGGTALAHYAGGITVKDRRLVGQAPDARLYRLGINSWEPTIGVDDDGTLFYQARNANLAPQVLRSTNEGHTWEVVSPTIAGAPAQPLSLDPILYLDKDTGRVFTNNIPPDITCQYVSFTDDKGETWTTSAICGHFDHQNIFTGPPVTSQTQDYPNLVYFCAINLVMLSGTSTATTCGKSLDGGLTWIHTGEPAYVTPVPPANDDEPICDGAVGHGFVDDQGTVYLPRVFCGQPFIAISTDEGLTWERIQVADNGGLGHESGIVVDSKGNAYYTWIGGDGLPYLAISHDRGRSWGKPMMIGPPGLKASSLPAIDVGMDGAIAITYAGSENFSEGNERPTWNGYITMTANALESRPVFYTGTINDPRDPFTVGDCGNVRCTTLGDFFDVTIAPDGTPWAAWVDGCRKPDDCIETFEAVGVRGEAVVGRLVGGPWLGREK